MQPKQHNNIITNNIRTMCHGRNWVAFTSGMSTYSVDAELKLASCSICFWRRSRSCLASSASRASRSFSIMSSACAINLACSASSFYWASKSASSYARIAASLAWLSRSASALRSELICEVPVGCHDPSWSGMSLSSNSLTHVDTLTFPYQAPGL